MKNINTITDDVEGYRISKLTKAVAMIYLQDYDQALCMLMEEDATKDVYEHIHLRGGCGKSSKDYAIEFCKAKIEKRN